MVGLADNGELGHHDEYGGAGQYQQAVGTSSFIGMGYMEGGGLISASRADQQDGRPDAGGLLGSLNLGFGCHSALPIFGDYCSRKVAN